MKYALSLFGAFLAIYAAAETVSTVKTATAAYTEALPKG